MVREAAVVSVPTGSGRHPEPLTQRLPPYRATVEPVAGLRK
jgi:hypothetical protein